MAMTSAVEKRSDGTVAITITIPWADIEKKYKEVVGVHVEGSELPGFRKGKAPAKMVEEKLDKSKIYEEVIKQILPTSYAEAIKDQGIRPIITPKVELKEAAENKDWIILAYTVERPGITLGDYRKAITDLKASKAKKIWVPGQDPKKDKKEESKPTMDEILRAVFEVVTISLPSLLLEQEVNRLLSELLDQTKKLGLTVDQYLAASGKTAESIRREYEEQAKRTLTLEFALEEIADKEGILVSDDDIDTIIKTAKTDQERESMKKERYYLASVLRRQKTLDFLSKI